MTTVNMRKVYAGCKRSSTHLVRSAEDVRIILLEPAYSGQTRQRPGQFVTMKHTKISQTHWQLPPRPRPMIKHQTDMT